MGVIATVAGTGATGFSGDGGAATAAIFSYPSGVAASPGGEILISDRSNNRLRKVSLVSRSARNHENNIMNDINGAGRCCQISTQYPRVILM